MSDGGKRKRENVIAECRIQKTEYLLIFLCLVVQCRMPARTCSKNTRAAQQPLSFKTATPLARVERTPDPCLFLRPRPLLLVLRSSHHTTRLVPLSSPAEPHQTRPFENILYAMYADENGPPGSHWDTNAPDGSDVRDGVWATPAGTVKLNPSLTGLAMLVTAGR